MYFIVGYSLPCCSWWVKRYIVGPCKSFRMATDVDEGLLEGRSSTFWHQFGILSKHRCLKMCFMGWGLDSIVEGIVMDRLKEARKLRLSNRDLSRSWPDVWKYRRQFHMDMYEGLIQRYGGFDTWCRTRLRSDGSGGVEKAGAGSAKVFKGWGCCQD